MIKERAIAPVVRVIRPPLFTPRFLYLLFTITIFGLSWSSYLILPKFLREELLAARDTIGYIAAIPGISAAVAAPLIGRLLDRYGRRHFFTLGCLIVVGTSLAFLFVDRVGPLLYIAQAIQGLGFLVAFNAASSLGADLAPPTRMAEALGIVGASNLIMNAVAPSIAEEIASRASWQHVFIFCAVIGGFATLLSFGLRDIPRAPGAPEEKGARRKAFMRPGLLSLYLGTIAFAFAFSTLFNFHQPFALEAGINEVKPFFIGYTITAFSMRVFFGRLADRLGALPVTAASLLAYAAVPSLLVLLGPTKIALVGAALGVTHGMLYPAMTAAVVERAGVALRGSSITYMNGAFHLGMAMAGLIAGNIAERLGYTAAFMSASFITLAGLALVLIFREPAGSKTAS